MKISRELSSYLDLLRFVAALAVMLGHMDQDGIPMNWIPIAKFSHESVIIFFVLSGFIIYNNTKSKNINSKEYSIARTSRIYSVALPAIFFSFLVSWAVELWASQPFPRSHLFFSFNDFFGSLFFLNQSWDNQTKLINPQQPILVFVLRSLVLCNFWCFCFYAGPDPLVFSNYCCFVRRSGHIGFISTLDHGRVGSIARAQ